MPHAITVKRVLAWQVDETMSDMRISKSEMARRMGTSRSALPANGMDIATEPMQ